MFDIEYKNSIENGLLSESTPVKVIVSPGWFGRHQTTAKVVQQPINKFQPTVVIALPIALQSDLEEEGGPPRQVSSVSLFQREIRNHPKLFLQTLGNLNLPIFFARGMELNKTVKRVLTSTPDGFREYVSMLLAALPDTPFDENQEKSGQST